MRPFALDTLITESRNVGASISSQLSNIANRNRILTFLPYQAPHISWLFSQWDGKQPSDVHTATTAIGTSSGSSCMTRQLINASFVIRHTIQVAVQHPTTDAMIHTPIACYVVFVPRLTYALLHFPAYKDSCSHGSKERDMFSLTLKQAPTLTIGLKVSEIYLSTNIQILTWKLCRRMIIRCLCSYLYHWHGVDCAKIEMRSMPLANLRYYSYLFP